MLKIALAQLNFHVGNFEANTGKIINTIEEAKGRKADLVLFPELCVCGYPPRDFLDYPHFLQQCYSSIEKIAAICYNIAVVVGAPSPNPSLNGKNLFNSAYFIADGKVQQIVSKSLLPNYDVFDEYRYFEQNTEFKVISFKGHKLALTVCEDLWDINSDRMYKFSPMDELASQGADIMLNIAASPFDYHHREARIKVLSENCKKYKIPLYYVNQVGAQTELIFDGGSMALDADGFLIKELPYFKEELVCFDTHDLKEEITVVSAQTERIYNALVLGIKDYFFKLGFKKAVLGLSGGIDSAIVCALAVAALGKENVHGVLMPSEYSSQHSVDDALALANNLGISHETLPIQNAFEAFKGILSNTFKGLSFNIAEENMQARSRGVLLMAISNKLGYVLLNTTNKSEMAVGYGTLYGDMCGGLSVLGDVYKTEVYELAHFINLSKEIIPQNTITKAPSAELRPGQKDSDSLPDYDVLDKILFQYIEQFKGPDEIIKQGFDEAIVKKVLRLVNINEYKRFQAAPVLRVSPKAFGIGRRMPLEGKYLS